MGCPVRCGAAAVSVASNIAEGKGKSSDGEFTHFLCHARGSLHELETQTLIAEHLGYLQDAAAKRIEAMTLETGKMLNGLIQFFRQDLMRLWRTTEHENRVQRAAT